MEQYLKKPGSDRVKYLETPEFHYCPLKSVLNEVGYLGLQIDVKTVKKGQYIFFSILWTDIPTAFTLIPVELNS